MRESDGIGRDVKKIQGFSERSALEMNAGKLNPAWDAGMALQERGGDSLVVLLLAERARSEGARSTRAIEDQPGCPQRRGQVSSEGDGEDGLLISCARATRGLRRPSLDARSGRSSRPPSREGSANKVGRAY